MLSLKKRTILSFFGKIQITSPDECWIWIGALVGPNKDKYGDHGCKILGNRKAHRIIWTLLNGPIPEGLIVCHDCDNTRCVNPNHLYVGTHKQNAHDRDSRGRHYNQNTYKTHCIRGHPLDATNTAITKSGGRNCILCRRMHLRNHYQKYKEQYAARHKARKARAANKVQD